MITIVGNGHGYVYGGGGADVIKITGDDNPEAAIFGGIGNDDCDAGDAGPGVGIYDCES